MFFIRATLGQDMRALALLALVLFVPVAAGAPEQVHLGIPHEDAATTRSVLWLDLDPHEAPATVRLEGPEGTREVAGRRVEGPSAGAVYEARLDGLAPGTTYTYTLGGRSFELQMPPAEGRPLRVVAVADMGISDRARATVRTIEELEPDLVLHMGDVSYAEGREEQWHEWFRMVEPVASRVPWVPALGNHETYTSTGLWARLERPSGAEIDLYRQRFGLPGNEIWYSFRAGDAHFFALDTYSQETIAREQVAWLDEELAGADARWKVAFLHEPPWSSNSHGSSKRVQDAFGALFEEHGVRLVLAGHDHGYERTRDIGGVTYVVSGGGGQSLYAKWEEPAPEWSAKRGSAYHVTLLVFHADRIEGRVVTTQGGDLADEFTIRAAGAGGAPAAILVPDQEVPALLPLAVIAVVAAFALLRRR